MNFFSVRTSTLRPGATLLFDLFVEFKGEHIHYRHRNQPFEGEVLARFKSKKIKKVYIPPEQEPLYLEYLDQALAQLDDPGQKLGEKAEFARDTLQQESEQIGKSLESEKGFRQTEQRIQKVVDFMLKEPAALANMLSAAGLTVDDSQHGSQVSTLALGLGVSSKYVDRDELTDLAVAGLLHDSALKGLGFSVQDNLESIAKERRSDFRRHPEVAIEQVAGKKFITARVLRIIGDHEEIGDGLGFPGKKKLSKLGVDSQIFNLCDAFDHFCLRGAKSLVESLDGFIETLGDRFDSDLLQHLEKHVRANPPAKEQSP
jgi:HD-GYP domain-containing protein (c-di-GMP phosphodiesterase class II)